MTAGGARAVRVLREYAAARQRKATTETTLTPCDDCGKPLLDHFNHDECIPTELDREDGGRVTYYTLSWGGLRFYLEAHTSDGRHWDIRSDLDAAPELGAACDYLSSWLASRAEE